MLRRTLIDKLKHQDDFLWESLLTKEKGQLLTALNEIEKEITKELNQIVERDEDIILSELAYKNLVNLVADAGRILWNSGSAI